MTRRQITQVAELVGPLVALVAIVVFWSSPPDLFGVLVLTVVLLGGVISAVHHVEVVAGYVGRVLGAIILALAVTIIEVALIAIVIIASADESVSTLGRDTVFAAVMITTNGIIGFSVVAATVRSRTSTFNSEGSGAALGAIATIATLSLVLPTFTTGTVGPTFTTPQLFFVAITSLAVYGLFLYVLTVRNREHFEDPGSRPTETLRLPPSRKKFLRSFTLLVVSLALIVGLAKVLSPSIETQVLAAGLPVSFVAVVIALVILLPEGVAAVRYARLGSLQASFNIGYGSALASIGLTIPVLAGISYFLDLNLAFGLRPVDIVLFLLTLVVSTVTVSSHRVTLFQGGLHLVMFAAFMFFAVSP